MKKANKKEDWKSKWIGDLPEPPLEYPLLYKHIGYLSAYSNKNTDEKWVQVDLGKTMKRVEINLGQAEGRFVRFVATKMQSYHHRIYLKEEDTDDTTKMFAFSLAELEIMNGYSIFEVDAGSYSVTSEI